MLVLSSFLQGEGFSLMKCYKCTLLCEMVCSTVKLVKHCGSQYHLCLQLQDYL